jgi:hypothetical protein
MLLYFQDGIVALAEVEKSYKLETRTTEVLIEALQSYTWIILCCTYG